MMKRMQCAILLGIVIVLIVSPTALATTTIQTVQATDVIESDGTCYLWIIEPRPPQHTYSHVNGDSVEVPLRLKWTDLRPSGSPQWALAAALSAAYGGTSYGFGLQHLSTGGGDAGWTSGSRTVPNVYVYTSMDVTYMAYVYVPGTPGNICYKETTITYDFVP